MTSPTREQSANSATSPAISETIGSAGPAITVAEPSRKAAAEYQLVETRLQEKLANGTTRCNLCLWRCKLAHGQRGFCQAHVNRNGTLYNLSYAGFGDRFARRCSQGADISLIGGTPLDYRSI